MIIATAVYLFRGPGLHITIAVVGVASTAAVVVGVRRYRPARAVSWYLIAVALLLNMVARLVYDALPGDPGTLKPWSWIVWLLHLVMLVALLVGAAGLARSTFRRASAAIDAAIIVLGAGLLGAVVIAIPYANMGDTTRLWEGIRVGYVLRDVIILALVIHLATALRWRSSVTLFLTGLLGLVVYDTIFRVGRIHGHWLQGTTLDLAWLLFFVAIGAAALVPSMVHFDTPMAPQARDGTPLRLGLVAALALMPSAVLLIGLFRRPPWYQPLIVIAATLILILALARIVDVARQLRRQVRGERVLRQAVTDLAGVRDVSTVLPTLVRAVGRLLPPGADYRVALWSPASSTAQTDQVMPLFPGLYETAALPADLCTALGTDGLTLAVPPARPAPSVRWDLDDGTTNDRPPLSPDDPITSPTLLVRSDRSALNALRPRLEVLATQAAFALDRIRLDEENVRHVSESYFRTLVQNSNDIILIVDDDNRIKYASPSAATVFGSSPVQGASLMTFVEYPGRAQAESLLDRVRSATSDATVSIDSTASEGLDHRDWIVRSPECPPARIEVSCRDLTSDASIGGIVLTLRNVTKQRMLEHELEQRAFHDPLTGLGNRLPFSERLDAIVNEPDRYPGVTAVLFADLDDLKLVNDALGHDTGDAVLTAVGARLKSFVDGRGGIENCFAARLGGDEFAVLLPSVIDQNDADKVADKLLEVLAQPVHLDGGHEVTCGASIGVATTAEDADTGQELLRNADLALYAAKGTGKGQWRHYEPWMRDTVMARLEVRSSLERAIEDNALLLEYQPIVALGDGRPVGFEALLRWQHPSRGRLSPKQFIDVAEESGLIAPIGEWVLVTAMAAACKWQEATPGISPYVGINVSARQFRTPGFIPTFQRLLDESGLQPDRVTLEITESLLLRDDDSVWRDLHSLRRSGVRIAIDDFGTGYSALSYLRHVPLDVVKLDRSFIQSMVSSGQQRELVAGIVGLADILGLDVVAEGIETETERTIAEQIGCAYGQGYLFSPAMSAADAQRWLIRPRREFAGRGSPSTAS